MAAALVMIPAGNDKLANARQQCIDALAAHASLHDAAQALGLFDVVAAEHAPWAHQVLGQLTANQNTTAHSAISNALNANQSVTLQYERHDGIDVVVQADPAGGVIVVFKAPYGHP
jgi:hypothetical protein